MFDWNYLLTGKKRGFPNSYPARSEDLYPDSLPLGCVGLGMQGSGKTTAFARMLVEHALQFPDEPIFVCDVSQSVSDEFLKITLSLPEKQKEMILKRVIYDELGHPEWVLTLPEFHKDHGFAYNKQTKRVSQNLVKINPDLKERAIMGGIPLIEYAPTLFDLLTVIKDDMGKPAQITEAKHLLMDVPLLQRVLYKYGEFAPTAKWFYENEYTNLKPDERHKRVMALVAVLNDIEDPAIRARVGATRCSYTVRRIIEKGQILLLNGRRVNDQDRTIQYLFTQVYSMIMNEIQQRTTHNPNDKRVILLFDEVYQLVGMPSFAPEFSRLSTYFRNKKLCTMILAQELSQFSDELRPHIFSYVNFLCWKLMNADDAYEVAYQLFRYSPDVIRFPARDVNDQPIAESERGQFLQIANEIRNMDHRECIGRKYISEKVPEKKIAWIRKTKDAKITVTLADVDEVKEQKLKEHGERVENVLREVNQRIKEIDRKSRSSGKKNDDEEPPNIA